jgi:hypothetical protein
VFLQGIVVIFLVSLSMTLTTRIAARLPFLEFKKEKEAAEDILNPAFFTYVERTALQLDRTDVDESAPDHPTRVSAEVNALMMDYLRALGSRRPTLRDFGKFVRSRIATRPDQSHVEMEIVRWIYELVVASPSPATRS